MTRKYFGTDGIRGRANEGKMTEPEFLKVDWLKQCKNIYLPETTSSIKIVCS